MKEVMGENCPYSFDLETAFGGANGTWEEGKVYFKGKRSNGAWLIKAEIFPIFGIYPQKVLKAYQDYSNSLRTSLRPIYEGDEAVIPAPSSLTKKDFPAQSTVSSRVCTTISKSRRAREHTLMSSVFESRISASFPREQQEKHEEPWAAVSQRVKWQREVLSKVPKWLDLALLATLALALTVLLGLYVTTEQAKQGTLDRVLDLHRRREMAVQASIYARQLSKLELFPNTSAQFSSLINDFKEQIQTLQKAADSDSSYRSANYDHKGLWWEYNGYSFEPYMLNAMDTLRALASHTEQAASHLNQSNTISAVSVVRNGIAESLMVLNSSMWAFMGGLREAEEGNGSFLPGLLVLSIGAISALFVAASCLVLKRTDSARKELWHILASLPVSLYAAARASSKQRLEVLHFTDFLELDLNEFSFKSRKTSNFPYARLSEWKWLLAALLLFTIGVVTGLVVIYSESRKDSAYFSSQVPKLVFYSGLRKIALLEVQFFAREAIYEASMQELGPQYYSNVEKDLERAGIQAQYYDRSLIYSREQLGIGEIALSSEEIDVLMDKIEGNEMLKHGSHIAIHTLLSDISQLPWLPVSFSTLEGRFSSLLSALEQLITANMAQAEALGQTQYRHYLSLLLAMAVCLLGFYVLVIKPLVLLLVRRIAEEWKLLLFLPHEAGVQVYRLMRK